MLDKNEWTYVTPKKPKNPGFDPSEWESVTSSSNDSGEESLGHAALMAIPRIGKDILEGAYGAFQKAPEYTEAAKTEVPGILNPLNALMHPIQRSKQALAGALQLGQSINHAPRALAQYAANRLNLIPREWANKVPAAPDLSPAIENYLGNPANPGDALMRGAVRNADVLLPATKATSALNPLNLTAKNIAKDVLKTREKKIGQYGKRYQALWQEAESKGFGDALYNIDVDLKTIKKYSPNKGIKGLEDFHKNPTLENAHDAKSDLLRIKRDLDSLTTLRTAERQQLAAVNDAINSINNNMFRGADGKIHEGMKTKYGQVQKGYKNEVIPYKNRAINEFIRGESSPEELVNSLSRRAFSAKRGEYHKALKYRKAFKDHPYLNSLGIVGAAALLLNKLFSKEHD